MFVDNREVFGRLTNPTTFGLLHLHNDLWQVFDNPIVSVHFASKYGNILTSEIYKD